MICGHSSQNEKIPQQILQQRKNLLWVYRIFRMKMGGIEQTSQIFSTPSTAISAKDERGSEMESIFAEKHLPPRSRQCRMPTILASKQMLGFVQPIPMMGITGRAQINDAQTPRALNKRTNADNTAGTGNRFRNGSFRFPQNYSSPWLKSECFSMCKMLL